MRLPVDFQNDKTLRDAFSYLTRIGVGVRFGGRPIGWYQAHQCAAIDALEEDSRPYGPGEIKTTGGEIFFIPDSGGCKFLGSVKRFFDIANNRARS